MHKSLYGDFSDCYLRYKKKTLNGIHANILHPLFVCLLFFLWCVVSTSGCFITILESFSNLLELQQPFLLVSLGT